MSQQTERAHAAARQNPSSMSLASAFVSPGQIYMNAYGIVSVLDVCTRAYCVHIAQRSLTLHALAPASAFARRGHLLLSQSRIPNPDHNLIWLIVYVARVRVCLCVCCLCTRARAYTHTLRCVYRISKRVCACAHGRVRVRRRRRRESLHYV